jgi:putative peptide zinc metalloprotease protein
LPHYYPGGDRLPGGPRQPLSGEAQPLSGEALSRDPGRHAQQPPDVTVPLPRVGAPEEGWIADYYRRLRRAAVVPADAVQSELLYLQAWGDRPPPARLALPAPKRSEAAPDDIGHMVPHLAPGVEQLGEYQGSGLTEATYLVQHPGGQVMQLSRLLHLVLSAVDGRRTVAEIAARVTVGFGRTVSVGNIEFLLANKLAPLGLLSTGETAGPAAGPPGHGASLLALRLRATIVPEAGVQHLARLFKPLFNPVIVVLVLAGLVASDTWLLRSGRLGPAADYVLYHPLLVLVVIGLTLLSTLFHECGHAAACRYGGARPGVIGMGIYVLWPAFFTNVTDAYRLGRGGRVRTDLGGVYFNVIFVLALVATYRLTGYEVLASAVVLTHLEIVQQLMPSLRFDGYFILADLIGVPDLFRRIGPTLRGLIPGQPQDPRVHDLKRPARLALSAWVLLIVPLLGGQLALIILNGPNLARAFAVSLKAQAQAAATEFGRIEIAAGLVSIISIVLLALPMGGIGYILVKMVTSTARKTVTATRGRPARRALAALAAFAVVAGLAVHWGALGLLPLRAGGGTPRPSAAGDVTAQGRGPAPSASAARAGHRAVVLDPVRAAGFDALDGLGRDPRNENTAGAKYAIDGSPATAWLTQYYLGSPFFGGLKKGSGLILDMGRPVTVSSVTIRFGRARGADVSIEVGNHDKLAAATLSTFTTVAKADGVGGTRTLTAARAVRGRYVLIWFTKLPPAGSGRFAAKIFNVIIRGSR